MLFVEVLFNSTVLVWLKDHITLCGGAVTLQILFTVDTQKFGKNRRFRLSELDERYYDSKDQYNLMQTFFALDFILGPNSIDSFGPENPLDWQIHGHSYPKSRGQIETTTHFDFGALAPWLSENDKLKALAVYLWHCLLNTGNLMSEGPPSAHLVSEWHYEPRRTLHRVKVVAVGRESILLAVAVSEQLRKVGYEHVSTTWTPHPSDTNTDKPTSVQRVEPAIIKKFAVRPKTDIILVEACCFDNWSLGQLRDMTDKFCSRSLRNHLNASKGLRRKRLCHKNSEGFLGYQYRTFLSRKRRRHTNQFARLSLFDVFPRLPHGKRRPSDDLKACFVHIGNTSCRSAVHAHWVPQT